jgi:hypothetical protein
MGNEQTDLHRSGVRSDEELSIPVDPAFRS